MAVEDTKTLTTLMTPRLLRRVAGESYFGRGDAYFAKGAVRSLRGDGDSVKAVVEGTRRYRVHLWVEDGDLGHDCTCPIGRDGAFCKHCVAVGLAWHTAGNNDNASATEDSITTFEEPDLQTYLSGLDKEDLVSLLIDQADEDERLHRQLTLRAALAAQDKPNASAWKNAFNAVLEIDDFVDYRNAYDYAAGVGEVVGSLDQMLQAGQADSVIRLAEHGLTELEQRLEYVDDSDGWMGALLERLQELHLEACRRTRPDPVDLAERLFEGEMESSFDTFYGAANTYANILGDTGIAAYRRLAEAEWAKIPPLQPGEDDPDRFGNRFRITSIMAAIAQASDDFDALVAVKSHDLSSPYAFLELATLHRDAGKPEQALDWAERGWHAFTDRPPDDRLRAFIAEAYQDRSRHDEAMELIWEAFVDSPRLETYEQLKRHGHRARQWPAWRDKALSQIREQIAGQKTEASDQQSWIYESLDDHSLLVEIFLRENDPQTAWREAKAGGCSQGLWLRLAKHREKTHPEDSVKVYKNHVAALLRNTGDHVYQEAIGTLEKIRAILSRTGKMATFQPFLDEIRTTHKRKRNLMKMLDRKSW